MDNILGNQKLWYSGNLYSMLKSSSNISKNSYRYCLYGLYRTRKLFINSSMTSESATYHNRIHFKECFILLCFCNPKHHYLCCNKDFLT